MNNIKVNLGELKIGCRVKVVRTDMPVDFEIWGKFYEYQETPIGRRYLVNTHKGLIGVEGSGIVEIAPRFEMENIKAEDFVKLLILNEDGTATESEWLEVMAIGHIAMSPTSGSYSHFKTNETILRLKNGVDAKELDITRWRSKSEVYKVEDIKDESTLQQFIDMLEEAGGIKFITLDDKIAAMKAINILASKVIN